VFGEGIEEGAKPDQNQSEINAFFVSLEGRQKINKRPANQGKTSFRRKIRMVVFGHVGRAEKSPKKFDPFRV